MVMGSWYIHCIQEPITCFNTMSDNRSDIEIPFGASLQDMTHKTPCGNVISIEHTASAVFD